MSPGRVRVEELQRVSPVISAQRFKRNPLHAGSPVGGAHPNSKHGRATAMDKDRIAGTAKDFAGQVEGAVGDLTGDSETQASGRVREATGKAQNL